MAIDDSCMKRKKVQIFLRDSAKENMYNMKEYMTDSFCTSPLKGLCRLMVSLANLRQRVVKVHFPPPLDVTWRTQQSRYSAEQQAISRASFSWWFIISRNLESTRSTINHSEHNYHELVPENLQGEHNNIILLAIYNVHNAIYRSTEYT